MKDISNITTLDEEELETVEMLKNNGIIIKGVSKAFTTFLILWFLSKQDMHGYLIMKKIDEFFKTQIEHGLLKETKANKIYPLLKSMKDKDLIKSYNGIHNKKEVKVYQLTEEGNKLLTLIKKSYKTNLKRDIWVEFLKDLDIQLKE